MMFISDNVVGASPKVLEAIVKANGGAAASYGGDPWSERSAQAFERLFERECEVFLVTTGTAANALAAAAICPPWGNLFAHRESHIFDDECGAPEFFTGGAKLVGLPGIGGRITPAILEMALAEQANGRRSPATGLSISQGNEFGQTYTPGEIAALAAICRQNGLKLHMDGARFSNAVVALGCSPAEMTWKAGIDLLSFGGTKNGCLMAEAVIFFDRALAADFKFRKKRAGQTLSKQRLIGAQFEAFLDGDHWRGLAAHANGMAELLAQGLETIPGIRLGWPQQINEVFPIVPRALAAHLKAGGARFAEWSAASLAPDNALRPDETVLRLVTSFVTNREEIEAFLALARGHNGGR